MITNWITSVFNLLGIEILESYTIFGITLSFQTLILINFVLIISFFIFEIILGIFHLLKKLYKF